MNVVVDAGVAVSWYVSGPGTEKAHALFETNELLIAPDLVMAEIGNSAWKLSRAGRISGDTASTIVYHAESAFSNLVSSAELIDRAFAIGRQLDHPIYDCLYLALAEREEARMVTTDKSFVRKVEGTNWEMQIELL